jgi:hypothetical protein
MNRGYLKTCDFDPEVYRDYEDLKSLSVIELENHFLNYGIEEGRFYNHIKSRQDFINAIGKDGKMLEIGPLDKPQLDYLSPDYFSLDVFTKEQLVQNYINDSNVDKNKIIEPSFVITDNNYSVINEKFNCVFSSHSIEHMPSVVTFLTSLEGLLNNDGFIYLIVPDKRYCFDYFRRETDIYDVLQSFYDGDIRPKFSDFLKMNTQTTHNECVRHWNNDHGAINFKQALLSHFDEYLEKYKTGIYLDSHVSTFTPESFVEIIETLKALKLINLKVHKLYHTIRFNLEFYVILKKSV